MSSDDGLTPWTPGASEWDEPGCMNKEAGVEWACDGPTTYRRTGPTDGTVSCDCGGEPCGLPLDPEWRDEDA